MIIKVDLPQDVVNWLNLNHRGMGRQALIFTIIKSHIESQRMFKGLSERDWRSVHADNVRRSALASPKEGEQ